MSAPPLWLERATPTSPRTVNDLIAKGMHERRRVMSEWREWAGWEAKGHPPIAGPVTVTVLHLRKTHATMPDVGALFLIAKAVIDGIVDAKVLPGDGPDVVTSLTLEAPVVVGYHGMRVIVRPGEQHVTKDQPAPSTGPIALPTTTPGETT